ncbi:kinectin-like [Megalops cyprinoides]|uniref:kinectin-like n=1 Tax=Megalops cyprinoides TaxID=118141 RepID=UPI001864A6C2|nr:kinectin-like [Megalops cyprinoides]
MEKNATSQQNDELELEKQARKVLEVKLGLAHLQVEQGKVLQAEMNFALEQARIKYQEVQEKCEQEASSQHEFIHILSQKLVKTVQEALQEQWEVWQNERTLLCQQLQEAQKNAEMEAQAVMNVQDCLNDTLDVMSADDNENMQMVMERRKHLVCKYKQLKECKKTGREIALWQLQQEVADIQKKLLMCETALEEKTTHCIDLQGEKLCVQIDKAELQQKLQEKEDENMQLKLCLDILRCTIEDKDHEIVASSTKLQESLPTAALLDRTIKQLEESGEQTKMQTATLEELAKQQSSRITMLEKEAEESAMVRKDLEEQLNQEMQNRNVLFLNGQAQLKEMEAVLYERQKVSETKAQQEALQDQIELMQNEQQMLHQQLEESQRNAEMKEQALRDMQYSLRETLAGMEAHNEKKEHEIIAYSQKLQEVLTTSMDMNKTIAELEESVLKMEMKNSRLEEAQLQEMEAALLKEKERVSKSSSQQEALQGQIELMQHERQMLHQQLEVAQKNAELKEQELKDLQDTLNDNQAKLSNCEALLKDNADHCKELKEDNLCMQKDKEKLHVMLQETEDKYAQSECFNYSLKAALDDKVHKINTYSQKLQENLVTSASLERIIKQLEESVQLKNLDNTRLEEAANLQINRAAMLQKEAEEAAIAKKDLEEHLNQELQKQNVLVLNAEAQLKEIEAVMLYEREKSSKANIQQKVLQDQIQLMQHEQQILHQQLEEAQKNAELKEHEMKDLWDTLNDNQGKIQAYNERTIHMVEERCKELTSKNAHLQELLDCKEAERENTLQQVQQELADSQTKLSNCEELLKDNALLYRNLKEENVCLQMDMEKLKVILQETEDRYVQSEHCNYTLKSALGEKEQNILAYSQKLQEDLATSTSMENTIKQLQEVAEQQNSRITMLQKEAEKVVMMKKDLEEKLTLEVQKQNVLFLKAQAQVKEMEAMLLYERQKISKANAQQEAFQNHIELMQSERTMLHQQLKEAQENTELKGQALRDMQSRLNNSLTKMKGYEERTQMLEERSTELASKNADLQELLSCREADRESTLSQMQQELSDSQSKLSICQASLKDSNYQCCELAEEKVRIQMDMNKLEQRLQESQDKFTHLEDRFHNLTFTLSDKEQEVITSSQKLHEVLSANAEMEKTVKQLEESVIQLEGEKSRMEALVEEQKNRITQLQSMLEKTTMVKKDSDEQISQDLQKKRLLTPNAHIQQRERELLDMEEEATKSKLLQDALQRLGEVKEATMLRQQLDEATKRAQDKEQELVDMQVHFSNLKRQSDNAETLQVVEEDRRELVTRNVDLQKLLECDTSVRERVLLQELADMQEKLWLCEESLEILSRHCSNVKEEKFYMQMDMKTLERLLHESEDQCIKSESSIHKLKTALDNKVCEVTSISKNLQKFLSAARSMEESIMRLETENAKLEARAKWQTDRITVLQHEADKLTMEKRTLEEAINLEIQKHSSVSRSELQLTQLHKEDTISRITSRVDEHSQQLKKMVKCCRLEDEDRNLAGKLHCLQSISESYRQMKGRAAFMGEELASLQQQMDTLMQSRELTPHGKYVNPFHEIHDMS